MVKLSWTHGWKHATGTLNLEQFWFRLGLCKNDFFVNLIKQTDRIQHVSFAYCSALTDGTLRNFLTVLAEKRCPLQSLNLFFCPQLTDNTTDFIVQTFPDLQELNLGRCVQFSGRSIRSLATLRHLRKLNMVWAVLPGWGLLTVRFVAQVHNTSVNEETFMILDDPDSFASLTEFDIQVRRSLFNWHSLFVLRAQHSSKDVQKFADEMKGTRPSLRILGPTPIRLVERTRKTAKQPLAAS
jgi:hypothetical protein